jgi:hypothetical protein
MLSEGHNLLKIQRFGPGMEDGILDSTDPTDLPVLSQRTKVICNKGKNWGQIGQKGQLY